MNSNSFNIKIDDSFYEPEVRDGFSIMGLVKRSWAAQLDVLSVIDNICKKHGIIWYADSGTLLGAVRHKGFVPWDDDIDISMRRTEYNRFIRILQYELPEGYHYMHSYSNDNTYKTFLRVINTKSVDFRQEFLENNHGCPYSCGIDVFPLDNVPSNEEDWKFYKNIVSMLFNMELMIDIVDSNTKEEYIVEVENTLGVKVDRSGDVRRQLLILTDAISSSYMEEDTGYVASIWQHIYAGRKRPYRVEWYDEVVELPFEGGFMPCPIGFHEVLCAMFGDNYMEPVKGTAIHEYPYFKEEKRIAHSVNDQDEGYETREQRVADALDLDINEVFEYTTINKEKSYSTYYYFCQSEMKKIRIPNDIKDKISIIIND